MKEKVIVNEQLYSFFKNEYLSLLTSNPIIRIYDYDRYTPIMFKHSLSVVTEGRLL